MLAHRVDALICQPASQPIYLGGVVVGDCCVNANKEILSVGEFYQFLTAERAQRDHWPRWLLCRKLQIKHAFPLKLLPPRLNWPLYWRGNALLQR